LIVQMKPLGFFVEEMRLLLDTRARLAKPDVDRAEREELSARLSIFALAAAGKLDRLREQFAVAAVFSSQLRAETLAAQPRAPSPRDRHQWLRRLAAGLHRVPPPCRPVRPLGPVRRM
jgi:hypothetical protein